MAIPELRPSIDEPTGEHRSLADPSPAFDEPTGEHRSLADYSPSIDETADEHRPIADPRPPRVAVTFGAVTDRGKVRDNNEDHFLIARLSKSMRVCKTSLPAETETQFSEEEGHLIVIADGMGGAAAGEHASALAVGSVERCVLNTLKWFLHQSADDQHHLMTELRQCLESADKTVMERARSVREFDGMGTTLTMAYSVAADLFIVHAGDSRAYLFRDRELVQLTHDHTLVQDLIDGGMISPANARRHILRHVVTNVIGGPDEGVSTEIHKLRLLDGDTLLFCTDGLTEPVDDEAIADVLNQYPDPEDACAQLLDLALSLGAPDNVTVVVARYQLDKPSQL
jgi:serine/threonine protein phosphatase PrpC